MIIIIALHTETIIYDPSLMIHDIIIVYHTNTGLFTFN